MSGAEGGGGGMPHPPILSRLPPLPLPLHTICRVLHLCLKIHRRQLLLHFIHTQNPLGGETVCVKGQRKGVNGRVENGKSCCASE